jgi:hypothetical protein
MKLRGVQSTLCASVFVVLTGPMAWAGNVYNFTQVSPVGQPINVLGGAAIDSAGLLAWSYGSNIQTWNGSTVTTYNTGVNVANVGSNIGLSDAGVVSFTSYNGSATFANTYALSGGTLTTFTYPGQTFTYFGGSSTNGLVAGDYAGNTGFIWTGGTSYTDVVYPGPHGQMYMYGVNSAGDSVGLNWCCGLGVSFLDKGGVFTTISVSGYTDDQVFAYNINNSDVVVGDTWNGTVQSGFLWQSGLSTIINYPGATDTILYGINSAGELVGEADFGDSTNGIVFTATLASQAPEPGTFALLLGAGVLLGAIRKRTR